MAAATPVRHARIDALRGIAVFGILLVNVWSFVKGNSTHRYGFLSESASFADWLVIFLTASFADSKFIVIFAFLFGAGFALQTRSLRRQLGDWNSAQAVYRRRLGWLLGCGIVHGVLIWYGDILTAYAVTGFLLLGVAGHRLRELRKQFVLLAWINLGLLIVLSAFVLGTQDIDLQEMIIAIQRDGKVYTTGGWSEIAALRLEDFVYLCVGTIFYLPELALLFVSGMMALRLGWLTRPGRHRRQWQVIQWIGLGLGIPVNLWVGWVTANEAVTPSAGGDMITSMFTLAGPLLASGYVATIMLPGAALERWFAPVGRMALSNYLMQSLIGVAVLQGTGLGLGATLSNAGLVFYCLIVMLVQAGWSHWWLARYPQGPIEALWRRHTMAATAPSQ